eukprot:2142149-Pyramimonas_sp.AAC.1
MTQILHDRACALAAKRWPDHPDPLLVKHVKGHEGQPWNTLADHLAGLVGKSVWGPFFLPPAWVEAIQVSRDREWEWLTLANSSTVGSYPVLEADGFRAPQIAHEANGLGHRPELRVTKVLQELEFKVASFNTKSAANTERRGAKGRLRFARNVAIKAQFDKEDIVLAGIQEARNPKGVYISGAHHVISSGSLNHELGCELWINTRVAYGEAKGQ